MTENPMDDPSGHFASPAERRNFLQKFAASLSGQEVRLMLEELNKRDFRCDILANLPMELHVHVVQYLDIADLWPCFNVSRKWRQILLDSHIVKKTAQRLLPGLLEYRGEAERTWSLDAPPLESLEDAVLRGIQTRYRRGSGKFRWAVSSSITFPMARSFPLDPAHHPVVSRSLRSYLNNCPASTNGYADDMFYSYAVDIKYHNGRICWHPLMGKPWIVVDNLRTCLRRVYTVPNLVLEGSWLRVEFLGDKLLVGSVGRIFHAWDLETGEHDFKTMPGIAKVLQCEGDRIWLDFEDVNQHILWKFRRGTQTLQTKGLKDSILRDGGIPSEELPRCHGRGLIFHPVDKSVALLFLLYTMENNDTGGNIQILGVCKFKDGSFSTATWRQLPDASFPYELDIRRANEYGEFVLLDMEDKEVLRSALIPHDEPQTPVMCFNALTEETCIKSFPAIGPRSHYQSHNVQAIWEGQMMSHNSIDLGRLENFNSFLRNFVIASRAITDPERGRPIAVYSPKRQANRLANRPLYQAREMGLTAPYIKSGIDLQSLDVRGRATLMESGVDYCLGIGRDMSQVDKVVSSALYADEDFIVLVLNNCWMAWNFTSTPPPEVPAVDQQTTTTTTTTRDEDAAMDETVESSPLVDWSEYFTPGTTLEVSRLEGPPPAPMQPDPIIETGLGAPSALAIQLIESLRQRPGEGSGSH